MRRKSFARRRGAGVALAGLVLASLAGCDKCGDPVKFNVPSVPKTCYGVNQDK
jgi:hypothetical protein